MKAIKLEAFFDTTEMTETTLFLKRNMPTLRANPPLLHRTTLLINTGQAFIYLTSKQGLIAEMSYPLLEIVSMMRKGGCR